jgi:hypothetical protein
MVFQGPGVWFLNTFVSISQNNVHLQCPLVRVGGDRASGHYDVGIKDFPPRAKNCGQIAAKPHMGENLRPAASQQEAHRSMKRVPKMNIPDPWSV